MSFETAGYATEDASASGSAAFPSACFRLPAVLPEPIVANDVPDAVLRARPASAKSKSLPSSSNSAIGEEARFGVLLKPFQPKMPRADVRCSHGDSGGGRRKQATIETTAQHVLSYLSFYSEVAAMTICSAHLPCALHC